MIIGRDPDVDIVLPHGQVSGRHAVVEPAMGPHFRVRDLGSTNGTFINGTRVEDGLASPSDELRFGSLVFEWDRYLGILLSEPTGGYTLGRNPGNDLVIPDQRISGVHARIFPKDDNILVIDCGSANGIFVNDCRVTRHIVTSRDLVRLGSLSVNLIGLAKARGILGPPAPDPIPPSQPALLFANPMPVTSYRIAASNIASFAASIGASASRQQKVLIPIVAALVLSVGLGFSFKAAEKELTNRISIVENELARVHNIAGNSVAGGHAKTSIGYDNLASYVAAFRQAKPILDQGVQAIRTGDGMAFWFPSRRREDANRLEATSRADAELTEAASHALSGLESLNREQNVLYGSLQNDWMGATNVLASTSDTTDFGNGIAVVLTAMSHAQAGLSTLRTRKSESLPGLAEEFRQGLLIGFSDRLQAERLRLLARRESLERARETLMQYKATIRNVAGGNRELLSVLGHISSALVPAVNVSYQKTTDLRAFLKKVEEPLGGDAGNMLAGVLGTHSGPITPIGLASQIDPQAGAVFAALKALCDALEKTHSEVNELANVTGAVLPPLHAFLGSNSRSDLLRLVSAAPQTASYFEARRGLFDAPINEMEKVRSPLHELSGRIGGIRAPMARSMLERGVNGALVVLDQLEAPFREANRIIESAGISMREIEAQETKYALLLNEFRSMTSPGGQSSLQAAGLNGKTVPGHSHKKLCAKLGGHLLEVEAVVVKDASPKVGERPRFQDSVPTDCFNIPQEVGFVLGGSKGRSKAGWRDLIGRPGYDTLRPKLLSADLA